MSDAELFQALHAVGYAPRYREWIFKKIENDLGEIVFDTGSGLGDFLDLFLKNPKRKIILSDMSEVMTGYLEARFRLIPEVQIVRWDISKENFTRFEESVDTVTCFNVLEHVEDDVQALKNIGRLVKTQGKLILFVPALKELYGSLDEMAGHYRRYTRKTLSACMHDAGWSISRMEYFNFFGILTWFLSAKIFRQKQLNSKVCASLDRIVPLLAWIERWSKPLIGQSLIVVAQKVS